MYRRRHGIRTRPNCVIDAIVYKTPSYEGVLYVVRVVFVDKIMLDSG